MKQFVRLTLATLLAFIASVSFAVVWEALPDPENLPPGIELGEPMELVDGEWVPARGGLGHVQLYRFGESWVKWCNGEARTPTGETVISVPAIDLEASIAQYVEIQLNKDHMTWYVFKPYWLESRLDPDTGDLIWDELPREFVCDSIHLGIKSNGDVAIVSEPLVNLTSTTTGREIDTWWSVVPMDTSGMPPAPTDPSWVGAGGMINIEMPEVLEHELQWFALWNRIRTHKCISACDYETFLRLYVVYLEQKPWVYNNQDLPIIDLFGDLN